MVTTNEVFWPTIGRFRFWLDCQIANRPRAFTYHYGFLPLDPGQWLMGDAMGVENAEMRDVVCPAVEEIAALAWEAYEAGRVVVVQRRVGAGLFEYIAILRAEPRASSGRKGDE